MAEEGGQLSEDRIFVTKVPDFALEAKAVDYGVENLAEIYSDAPVHGFTFLVVPAASEVHKALRSSPSCEGFLLRDGRLVAGVRVDRIGKEFPASSTEGREPPSMPDVSRSISRCRPTWWPISTLSTFSRAAERCDSLRGSGLPYWQMPHQRGAGQLGGVHHRKGMPTEFRWWGTTTAARSTFPSKTSRPLKASWKCMRRFFQAWTIDLPSGRRLSGRLCSCHRKRGWRACFCLQLHSQLPVRKLEGKKTGHLTGPFTFGEIAHNC